MLNTAIQRYSTTPLAGQRRAIAVNLVVFFFFALTAVVMLTRTAMAANAINNDVTNAIEPAVDGIDEGTSQLPALDVTARVTSRIAAAAEPLPGDLRGVVVATDHINKHLASTRASASSIGASVDGIKKSTGAIRPDVETLAHEVEGIRGTAGEIETRLARVAALSAAMRRDLSGANTSLGDILRSTGPLNIAVRAIQRTAALVDVHARRIADSPILLRNPLNLMPLLGNILGGE